MRRAFATACLALAALLALALAPAAGAGAPAKVKVGKVRTVGLGSDRPSLLVPVSYPIETTNRGVRLVVSVRQAGVGTIRTSRLHTRASAGPLRSPERRGRFTFVHRVGVGPVVADALRAGAHAVVRARARIDLDRDGDPELASTDSSRQPLALVPARASRLCSSVPSLRTRPGRRIGVRLPVCTGGARWKLADRPDRGSARIRDGRLIFRSGKNFRGTISATLVAASPRGSARRKPVSVPVQVTVGSAEAPVVRALGDSVTAGFGYYDDGSLMELSSLLSCKPGESSYDDACSSNSSVRSNAVEKVEYAPDYGLSNNISWVAQWANEHGITNFKNYAVSGSEPSDWFGKGQFAATARQLASEDPDYVLLTMGANPLLSDMLFGVDNMGCAIWADFFGRYEQCLEEAFAEIGLRANLRTLYSNLVSSSEAEILVMQYHLSVPSSALAYSATQIALMGKLINREIAAVAAAVNPRRIEVVAPPHFDVGIDISPVYPSNFSCSRLGYTVDGPSVQSTPTQDELLISHPLSFCEGPVTGPPWVISGDTGIHPSAAGYAQMASQVPAPR